METTKLYVYDPPMCCSSGVCGPSVDPQLVRFSSDLDWLRQQGVEVERYSLSSDPAEFARNTAVKEALQNDGNDCLPLIIVNGSIVSKGAYPARSELANFCGIEGGEAVAEAAIEPETVACGPGCNCGAPAGGRAMKTVVSLLVLLAVAGIIAYKVSSAKADTQDNTAAQAEPVFAIAPADEPVAENASAPEKTTDVQKIGENIESIGDLNKVALEQDAVFVYIPAENNEPASSATTEAVLAAQEALKSNNVKLGLFTLSVTSPDYAGISKQAQAPAILVAVKGKSMSAVSGEVTETKLLQTYMASSRGGGCGAGSSCAPSDPNCK